MSPSSQSPDPEENSDYVAPQNDAELQKIHESIIREKTEPKEGREPLPTWLLIFFFLIVFAGGLYLGTHSAGFRGDVFELPPDGTNSFPEKLAKQNEPLVIGRRLFMVNCSECHQPSGIGVPGKVPPLAGSEIVISQKGWEPNHLVKILLNGLSGPIEIQGRPQFYSGEMVARKELLKDKEIALILTYIRQDWGNRAGPITSEDVAAMRPESDSRQIPWTQPELRAIPAKNLPSSP